MKCDTGGVGASICIVFLVLIASIIISYIVCGAVWDDGGSQEVPITVIDKSVAGGFFGSRYYIETDVGCYQTNWKLYSRIVIGDSYVVKIRKSVIKDIVYENQ